MGQESQAVADVGVSAPLEVRFCPGRGKSSRPDAGEPRDAPLHSPALPASPPCSRSFPRSLFLSSFPLSFVSAPPTLLNQLESILCWCQASTQLGLPGAEDQS